MKVAALNLSLLCLLAGAWGCSSDDPAPGPCDGVACGAGQCVVADGAASCECNEGYSASGLTCVANTCEGVTCGGHGTCSLVSGEPTCACEDGYSASGESCELSELALFVGGELNSVFRLRVGGGDHWEGVDVSEQTSIDGAISASLVAGRKAKSAVEVTWADAGEIYTGTSNDEVKDLARFVDNDTALSMRIRVDDPPTGDGVVVIRMDSASANSEFPFASVLSNLADGQWHDYGIPLRCFMGPRPSFDLELMKRPFLLFSNVPMTVTLEDVRWVPGAAAALDCSDFFTPVDDATLWLYGPSGLNTDYQFGGWAAFDGHVTDAQADVGGGDMAWAAHLLQGSTTVISHIGSNVDLSAYSGPTSKLMFDVAVKDYKGHKTDGTDVLIKIAGSWPYISDLRLFDEILKTRPDENVWQRDVTVMMTDFVAGDNEIEPSIANVDLHYVAELFNAEVRGTGFVDGVDGVEVYFDNIRFVK